LHKENEPKESAAVHLVSLRLTALCSLEKPGAAKLATFSGSNRFQRYSVFSCSAWLREMA
jgi:hypothetical protein